ncbi:26S proteasome non-ATPase regulatory subunit 3-like [Oopsacas minuta]|uniref:26S proteasome non-ATPase regulatory subunit 3-like n=1 Tax=Oopsacas minuta TaxID=111878 RepID=A0AAV7JPK6_9METZ|nr:26S proteasome non-ATPase regulatory subunit 3-like [Oopsacas minuta]
MSSEQSTEVSVASEGSKTEEMQVDRDQPETPAPLDKDSITVGDIRDQIRLLERSVQLQENRFIFRVLRALNSTRKRINCAVLHKLISSTYPTDSPLQKELLSYLPELMSSDISNAQQEVGKKAPVTILPEVDAYLHLLVLLFLLDTNTSDPHSKPCADSLSMKLGAHNRRSLDMLASKCYFYHARVYELEGNLHKLRGFLHGRLRTCTLRRDEYGQAVLMNLLLRNYIHYNLFDQASKLVSKASFPEHASNNETARYLFYVGRIKATQLEYAEAHRCLLQAMRKAPQNTAIGFKQTASKFAVVVQLLIGEIPDRNIFYDKHLVRPLAPYFQLVQNVRTGDLNKFSQLLEVSKGKFLEDRTYTLIMRLRHNVIKTGIKMISMSYSRISLEELGSKLGLGSAENAEFIVAKAIRDKVIDASIDHEQGFMRSREVRDIYITSEPQTAFHQRICFCLEVRNEAVKAMRFPPKAYKQGEKEARDFSDHIDLVELVEDDDDFS